MMAITKQKNDRRIGYELTSETQAPGWLALAPNQVLVVISSIC